MIYSKVQIAKHFIATLEEEEDQDEALALPDIKANCKVSWSNIFARIYKYINGMQ